MTNEEKADIWVVLIEEAGAPTSLWDQFKHHFPECREFRFQGDLGFGGKVWADRGRIFVACYKEDETPERLAIIERTNAALAELTRDFSAEDIPTRGKAPTTP